jgi:hypothetical protein
MRADESDSLNVVHKVVAAAGGEQHLLRKFKMTERLNVSSNPDKPGNVRHSVLEPPKNWWVGKKERVSEEKEPATFLVWAWTLAPLIEPTSKIEKIPDVVEQERTAIGLRVSDSIAPPMDLYFDPSNFRLLRIDWRSDIHRFSDWKEHDGAKYPSKCVGFKKESGKPWYFTEITELQRLEELPQDLKR